MPKLLSGAEIVFKTLEDQKVEYVNSAIEKLIHLKEEDIIVINFDK